MFLFNELINLNNSILLVAGLIIDKQKIKLYLEVFYFYSF